MSLRHYLPRDTLLGVVQHTPLVSIDLILRNARGEVLLCLRENRPARHTWFVPGGRILKDERVADALRRIAAAELGLLPDEVAAARFLGVFEHLYPDNFAGAEDISTHYVVLGYEVQAGVESVRALDSQHSALRWFGVDELLAAEEVHINTRAYFDERITVTRTERQAPGLSPGSSDQAGTACHGSCMKIQFNDGDREDAQAAHQGQARGRAVGDGA